MKSFPLLILFFLFVSCAKGKEMVYTGCTPAGKEVRSFLGISLSDSVDFIRWWIAIEDEKFTLKCNYGIGKPNTNDFINGGKWIDKAGKSGKENNYYYHLKMGRKELVIVQLNSNLIHLLDENKNFLVGNGGWSYTLNANFPSVSDEINVISKEESLKDSMTYQGRTPCGDFSINRQNKDCIKMKWSIVFYANAKTNQPTTYLLNRSSVSNGKTGIWTIIERKGGRILYQLIPDNGSEPTHLLKIDENVLVFTDAKGNLLTGNKDFSFTLNRK